MKKINFRLSKTKKQKSRLSALVKKYTPKNKWLKTGLIVFLITMSLGFVSSAYCAMAYSSKALPNAYLAQHKIGSLRQDDIHSKIVEQFSNTTVSIQYKNQKESIELTKLAPEIDYSKVNHEVFKRSISDYLGGWMLKHEINLPLSIGLTELSKELEQFKDKEFVKPKNVSFVYEDNSLQISEGKPGFGLDSWEAKSELDRVLGSDLNSKTVIMEPKALNPVISREYMLEHQAEVEKVIDQKYLLSYGDKNFQPTKKQIASWLEVVKTIDGFELKPKKEAVDKYVDGVVTKLDVAPINKEISVYKSGKKDAVTVQGKNGLKILDVEEAKKALTESIKEAEKLEYELNSEVVKFESIKVPVDDTVSRTYTYSVEVRGAVGSDVALFKSQANATLNDPRGWAAAGIAFVEVPSGGDFTLLLASPQQVAAVGGICDAYYSCRVGRYVVINDARWAGATAPWNSSGGSIRDYRHMLINHETGHWLGFYHGYCGGSGQPAPVMQQQSISLQGCRFNPWPLPSEIRGL